MATTLETDDPEPLVGASVAVLAPHSDLCWSFSAGEKKRSSLLNCVVIDRRVERSGSISGSDLLAVQIGYSTADVRGDSLWECTLRISFRLLKERQTACLQVRRNSKWKVREILCALKARVNGTASI